MLNQIAWVCGTPLIGTSPPMLIEIQATEFLSEVTIADDRITRDLHGWDCCVLDVMESSLSDCRPRPSTAKTSMGGWWT